MEHSYAYEHHFVEQYLLDELPSEVRGEFEEHFFDCLTCAAELKMTSEFLQAARSELQRPEVPGSAPVFATPRRARTTLLGLLQLRPTYAAMALAACLLLVVYQNSVTLPQLRNEVARLDTPAVLPAVSLVGGNSRGGNTPTVSLNGAATVLLQVDIPTHDELSRYTCSLYSPAHRLVWSVDVTAEAARDTVFLRAPLGNAASGIYTLAVQGISSQGNSNSPGIEIAKYYFILKTEVSQSGH